MIDTTTTLNARVGRHASRALPAAATPAATAHMRGVLHYCAGFSNPVVLLAALAIALWPHWTWMARRLTDGSDEPWGVLALLTVIVLVGREWRALAMPSATVLLAAATLAVTAAIARWWMPPLVAAAIATAALAFFLVAARRDRPAVPLATLLLLALPVIASLQFYFGYPLRLVTAVLAAPVLRTLGFAVEAAGAAFAYDGGLVLVDPPCAGIGMLWVGAYTAALLSYLGKASALRTLANGGVAAVCVFFANVVRNVLLFIPNAYGFTLPEWTHALIGLVVFGLALIPIVLFAHSSGRGNRGGWPAWPQRYHRRIA